MELVIGFLVLAGIIVVWKLGEALLDSAGDELEAGARIIGRKARHKNSGSKYIRTETEGTPDEPEVQ